MKNREFNLMLTWMILTLVTNKPYHVTSLYRILDINLGAYSSSPNMYTNQCNILFSLHLL